MLATQRKAPEFDVCREEVGTIFTTAAEPLPSLEVRRIGSRLVIGGSVDAENVAVDWSELVACLSLVPAGSDQMFRDPLRNTLATLPRMSLTDAEALIISNALPSAMKPFRFIMKVSRSIGHRACPYAAHWSLVGGLLICDIVSVIAQRTSKPRWDRIWRWKQHHIFKGRAWRQCLLHKGRSLPVGSTKQPGFAGARVRPLRSRSAMRRKPLVAIESARTRQVSQRL